MLGVKKLFSDINVPDLLRKQKNYGQYNFLHTLMEIAILRFAKVANLFESFLFIFIQSCLVFFFLLNFYYKSKELAIRQNIVMLCNRVGTFIVFPNQALI